MKTKSIIGLAGLTAVLVVAGAVAQQKPAREWRSYGGDKGFTRYSPLGQINRDNVRELRVVWRKPALDPQISGKFPDLVSSNYFRGTPIIVNGVLYVKFDCSMYFFCRQRPKGTSCPCQNGFR